MIFCLLQAGKLNLRSKLYHHRFVLHHFIKNLYYSHIHCFSEMLLSFSDQINLYFLKSLVPGKSKNERKFLSFLINGRKGLKTFAFNWSNPDLWISGLVLIGRIVFESFGHILIQFFNSRLIGGVSA